MKPTGTDELTDTYVHDFTGYVKNSMTYTGASH
jgi:hypothetical protein